MAKKANTKPVEAVEVEEEETGIPTAFSKIWEDEEDED